jgi:ABC-type enterochelin transport system substrate-binding protein
MASNVDGAGLAKLETLEQAVTHVQRLNTIVERMAQSARMMQPLTAYRQQIHRAATPLAGLLKPQFENISNVVTNLILISTRGGSDQQKVRGLRESVAQIRVQIEAAETRVRKQHTVVDEGPA